MSLELIVLTVIAGFLLLTVGGVFYLTLNDKAASLVEFSENLSYLFTIALIVVAFVLLRRRGDRAPGNGTRSVTEILNERAGSVSPAAAKTKARAEPDEE